MKKLAITLALIVALGILSFAQEPQQPKSIEQLMSEWRQEDNQYRLSQLTGWRQKTEAELAKYNELRAKQANELTEKLKRAVNDGDATLIEVALNQIRANKAELQFSAKRLVEEHGLNLLTSARETYSHDLISEEQYMEHLTFFRQAKARTEEADPEELTKLVEVAREKVPDYFTMLAQIGKPWE